MNQTLTELFLAELEREAKGTRRALERVPDGHADWKPHQKSMSLGQLAGLVAGMPGWIDMIINMDELDLGGGGNGHRPKPKTSQELLDDHEGALKKAQESLKKTTEEHLMTSWKLKAGGKVVLDQPRHIVIRDTISHLAHHRGQLTVFLRLLDAPVPAIYGPSADDARFD